jgi:type II secretory pathway pseudopilin PulG
MKRKSYQINSFFIEIIIVILFFAVSAGVTLQLFVSANKRAQQSSELSTAVVQAENVAEQLKGLSSPDGVAEILRNAKKTGSSGGKEHYRISFDKSWKETNDNPGYIVDVAVSQTPAETGVTVNAEISVCREDPNDEVKIYSLNTAKYLPKAS